jgi:hypothetical protein
VRRRPPVALAVVAAVAALALAGCSSGKGSSSATPTTAKSSSPASSIKGSTDPFCNFVRTFDSRFGQINPGLADPTQLKSTVQDAAGAISGAESMAPAQIKGDVSLLNDAFQKLATALAQINYDLTKAAQAPQVLASLQQLQSPDYAAASQRIDNYISQNCA